MYFGIYCYFDLLVTPADMMTNNAAVVTLFLVVTVESGMFLPKE